jgi:hypothetical protein
MIELTFDIFNIVEQFKNPDYLKGLLQGFLLTILLTYILIIIPYKKFINDQMTKNEDYRNSMERQVKADESEQ